MVARCTFQNVPERARYLWTVLLALHTPPGALFNGLRLKEANILAIEKLKTSDYRLYRSSQNKRDWSVSRQRYWATPIPLIHCSKCGTVPVPEEDLPVELPPLKGLLKRGDVPLRENEEWLRTTCPNCGEPAERETDTLDTFVDSAWYYLRFLDPQNDKEICSVENAQKHMPVDIYVGGIEHAIRHLFYARFIAHFLHKELGLLPFREPFKKFLPVGLVLGITYKNPTTGQFFSADKVEKDGSGLFRSKETGEILVESWEKMSKSKLNGVEPSEVIARHGLELTRLTMLASVGPHAARQWNEGERSSSSQFYYWVALAGFDLVISDMPEITHSATVKMLNSFFKLNSHHLQADETSKDAFNIAEANS
ncbi:hypothetical protein ACTXT7_015322 [Hymenolepis weldensis]